MTSLNCWADNCKWNGYGWCNRGAISISDEYECECFEDYRDSYKFSYWIACRKNGESYRRLIKRGERIEYSGYVFYTEDKITEDESYRVTEERTGVSAGEFRKMKNRWDKFVEICATLPNVSSYPIKEEGSENGT